MSRYTWDRAAGRYRDTTTGRYVPRPAVREAVDAVLAGGRDRVTALSGRLVAGRITVAEWQTGMARELRLLHSASAAAGAGGWAAMTPADWGRTGHALRAQYQYLQAFAVDIASGRVTGPALTARAAQYVEAARGTYEAQARVTAHGAGMTEERNVLHASESCPGCVAAAEAGWQPLGSLPAIGARDCRANCRCTLIYRAAPAAAAA